MTERTERRKRKKIDMELRAKIKEMESKKREEQAQNTTITSQEQTISFDQWWMGASRKLKLKYHMKEIIWADFKARGLKRNEKRERFDEACGLFGYKI